MAKRRRKDQRDFTADLEAENFDSTDADDTNNEQLLLQSKNDVLRPEFQNVLDNSDELNNDNFCRDFVRNICRRGRKCKYKHPTGSQIVWTNKVENKINGNQVEVNFCHDYQNNGCNRPQCRFIHCNRPEQEFYYATGILLSKVPCNNIQVPLCKDFLNGSCTRVKCKYLHLNNDEIDQQNNFHELKNNYQSADYSNYNHRSTVEHSTILPNSNFFPNTNTSFFPVTQQLNGMPSQTISLGNSLPLTNAQFTVSLPLGSVSYSTSQPQLIAQPTLTNMQYIHDPILSSVAHEIGPLNSEVITQIPSSNQHNIVSQIHPQQQVVYSGIIHNSSVSLPQHHTIQPQFTLISSDSQNHSQLISAPLAVGSSNATGHIINPVAVAHPNPSQNQQYTISQQPPVGMSIFSVATPCSILSASPTTADVIQTIQQQQLRSYDQNESTCMVQKNIKANGNVEYSVNDNSHINSTLTPIYIQHSLPSAVPVTQYRVTALESTAAPSIVIHNPIDRNNVTLVHATTTSNNETIQGFNSDDCSLTKSLCSRKVPEKILSDKYFYIMKENEKLKKKLMELQKQTNDLQTANELLLDQNARLRNSKSCCNVSGNNVSLESTSVNSQNVDSILTSINNHPQRCSTIQCSSNNNNQLLQSKQNDTVSNSMSEMATITLTVPIGKPHITQSLDYSSSAVSMLNVPCSMGEISYSMSSNNTESYHKNVLSTSACSNYISPTLVSSAIRSIQKSVMPTLHALVASSNAISTADCSVKQDSDNNNIANHCIMKSEFYIDDCSDIEVPMRSSSCPVTCSYTSIPDQLINCDEVTCYYKQNDLNHTAQLCFQ